VTPEPSGTHTAPDPSIPSAGDSRTTLGPAEAAIVETFVVPRYLSLFGELALDMIVESDDARVVHVNCRTGYPDRGLARRLRGAHVIGVDPSPAAVELARAKAAAMPDMVTSYVVHADLVTTLPSGAFSHAMTLHPNVGPGERKPMLAELVRLLAPYGQALFALPMRGSFQEIMDLFREYALKFDDVEFAHAVERATASRPTVETLSEELEDVGFDFVDVALRPAVLRFQSGRDFFEDPVSRILLVPDVQLSLGVADISKPLAYVRDAIDKYWSEGSFELSIQVGCATGRRTAAS
jgi:SAM-dependent methyltransferase